MITTLQKNTNKFLAQGVKTVAHSDQSKFITARRNSLEGGYRMMIEGLEIYAEAFKAEYGTPVGEDGFLGQYLSEVLHGLRGLESGLGRFDGGTLDKTMCELAEAHKLEIE